MIYNTLLCIGDSLTFGARDEFNRGYPAELSSYLNKIDPSQFWMVINEGVNGRRSGDLLRVLPHLLMHPEAQAVLIEIGTNDCVDQLPLDLYRDNIFQILKTCQCCQSPFNQVYRYKRKILVGSLISLEGFGLLYYGKEGQELLVKYNEILKEITKEFGVPLVDLTPLAKYRIDACHLNNAGYKEMARLFGEEILRI